MARTSSTAAQHHVRFARAVALLSTLGATALSGCYDQHGRGVPETDGGAPADAAVVDAGHDAGVTCETCICAFGNPVPPGQVDCNDVGLWTCCAAIGPLAPPDLLV